MQWRQPYLLSPRLIRHNALLDFAVFLTLILVPSTTIAVKKSTTNIFNNNPFTLLSKKKSSKLASITSKISSEVSTAVEQKKKTTTKIVAQILPNKNELLYVVQNLLAGLASSIALVPEVCTFAITAGLHPLVGLGSTVILASISGCLGGRPGLVSGATATVSMILKPLCDEQGHLVVCLAVIMAGFFQLGLGSTRCGQYIRVVPRTTMLGFVNGLAIKVVRAQIPHFQHPHGVWLRGEALKWHSILVLASALIIDVLPRYTKLLPSPLVALVLAATVANYYDLPVPRLVDMVGPEAFEGGLETLKQALFPFRTDASIFPPFGTILTRETLALALPTAIEMAVVGLLQTLLTLQIVDSKTHTKGKNTKESIAQGLGNVVSGAMGGMGGSALLGQSLVNVNSGGTGRLSSISVAVFVLAGVTFFAPILGGLPVAALVGLMLTVAQHTFSWDLLEDLYKGQLPLADILIILSVTWTTAYLNMAAAVGLGVLVSALRFAWQASCNMSAREEIGIGRSLLKHANVRYIRVTGPLFFGSATTFQKLCEPSAKDRDAAKKYRARLANRLRKKGTPPPDKLTFKTGRETVIDFIESQVWDHAAVMAIETLARDYDNLGVKLHLRHLSSDCREKLLESSDIDELSTELDVDILGDPTYLVGEDPKTTK